MARVPREQRACQSESLTYRNGAFLPGGVRRLLGLLDNLLQRLDRSLQDDQVGFEPRNALR